MVLSWVRWEGRRYRLPGWQVVATDSLRQGGTGPTWLALHLQERRLTGFLAELAQLASEGLDGAGAGVERP